MDHRLALIRQITDAELALRKVSVIHVGQLLAEADLSVPQMRLLIAVDTEGRGSVLDIAERLQLSTPTVTTSVDRLVKRGLLTREENPEDRRRKQIALSPAARALLDSLATTGLNTLMAGLEHLDDEELETFHRLVLKLSTGQDQATASA